MRRMSETNENRVTIGDAQNVEIIGINTLIQMKPFLNNMMNQSQDENLIEFLRLFQKFLALKQNADICNVNPQIGVNEFDGDEKSDEIKNLIKNGNILINSLLARQRLEYQQQIHERIVHEQQQFIAQQNSNSIKQAIISFVLKPNRYFYYFLILPLLITNWSCIILGLLLQLQLFTINLVLVKCIKKVIK